MARRPVPKGQCSYCQKIFGKIAIKKHLQECENRKIILETGKGEKCFHILVESYRKTYWLYIGIPVSATLEDLDQFLRDIWLECCEHLSVFKINEIRYNSMNAVTDYFPKGMNYKLSEVLSPGVGFIHEYDFGTTTALILTVLSEYSEKIEGKKVTLMARNELPEEKHFEFIYSEDILKINSPRAGICGYWE